MRSLVELLSQLRSLDVQLSIEGDSLRVSAPKDALTSSLRSELAENKPAIIQFLRSPAGQAWLRKLPAALSDKGIPPILPVSLQNQNPLSFAQQRLWFLSQLEGSSATYNIPLVLELNGPLDLPALHKSCAEIVRCHESLRTTFSVDEHGQPFQVIMLPEIAADMPAIQLLDLHGLPGETRRAEALRITQQEARSPFNLESTTPGGGLYRLLLLRLDEQEHLLCIVMHHIIADGWSLDVFCRQLADLYRAFSSGAAAQLPILPVQYHDYAIWQREWLQGATFEKHKEYWVKQLKSPLPSIELPTDRPRPSVQSYRGAIYHFKLPQPILEQVKQIAGQYRVTLFTTLLAAFNTLLFRYTGQPDLVIGVPVANRSQPEIENLIGFFVNTLLLRNDLSGNPKFSELLQRVHLTNLDAFDHQELPFEKLVEALQPERNLSHSPLFQVMFALESSLPRLEVNRLKITSSLVENGSAKFDLTLFVVETEHGLSARFEYNTDLFDAATIARLSAHYTNLLAGIAADPALPIASLPLLSQAEQQYILEVWNATQTPLPDGIFVHHLIEAHAQRTPHAIAVQAQERFLTYQELNHGADSLAQTLQSLSIAPGSIVSICMERSPEMLLGLLGVLKAGAAYLPIDPIYPPDRIAYMLQDSSTKVLLSQRRLETKLHDALSQANCRVIYLDELNLEVREQDHTPTAINIQLSPDDLAYVIYTSGTTGLPKGVMISHRGLVNYLLWSQRYYPVEQGAGSPVHSSISFDLTITSIFTPLLAGKKVVLLSEDLGVESLGKDLQVAENRSSEDRYSLIKITPAHLQIIGEVLPPALAENAAHAFIIGGENLTAEQIKYWQTYAPDTLLINEYGPTETVVGCCIYTVPHKKHAGVNRNPSGAIPIGRPISNTRLYVLDANLQPVPIGVRGELYIGGAGVARGYLNRPDLTAEKFIPDPYSPSPGERMYRTGDLARYLHDGNLECLGRVDFQVKIRGYRIELGEIDTNLQSHPAVRRAAAWVWDSPDSRQLVAYIVPRDPETPPSSDELRKHLRHFLPDYMLPSIYLHIDAMPLTANGKVDYRNLPAPKIIPLENEAKYHQPRNPIEQVLASIWSEILGLERVGIFDNFFELGGHSLLAVQVISRTRRALRAELSIRNLFEMPTIAALADYISRLRPTGQETAPPVTRVPRDVPLALSYAQQRLWFLDQLKGPSAIYNVPWAIRFAGQLNIPALGQAINEIVRRHEALRTGFPISDGQPTQLIIPSLEIAIQVHDLQDIPLNERLPQAIALASTDARQPFNLTSPPLFRCYLYRITPEEHVLLFNLHHIISDGWSVDNFMNELNTLYRAFSNHQPSPLPELEVQYADFSRWQRDWVFCEALERQTSYWSQRLADSPTLLQLPTDHPRPAIQTFAGHTLNFTLDKRLSDQIRTLSNKTGSTLFMVTCTAFAALLNRYSGQKDIVIGVPMANRSRQELEPLIGFFVNTLPLRIQFTGNPTFGELLDRVRQATLDAYMHQDVPFERLVEEIHPERSLSYTPVFQVMFTLQNTLYEQIKWPSMLEASSLSIEVGVSKFDLGLSLQETPDGLVGAIEYSTDLFEAATIQRMIQHFIQLLESAAADIDQPALQMPFLSAKELHTILHDFNRTQAEFPQDSCVQYLFEEQVERTPNAIAVRFGEQFLTYAELDRKTNQLANFLQNQGAGPGTLVGILINRSLEMVIGLVSILKAGAAYLPLDPEYPPERIRFMVDDAQSPILLTQETLLEYLPANLNAQIVRLDSEWKKIAAYPASHAECSAGPDDLTNVIYTSGSTGIPKGVQITQRALVNLLESVRREPGMNQNDIIVALTPISFDIHAVEIFLPLLVGAQIVLVSRTTSMDGRRLGALLKQTGVTIIQATPVTYKILIESGWMGLPGLKVFCGGEAMSRELANGLMQRADIVWNMYGPTETTVYSTIHRVTPGSSAIPIGKPVANTQAYVLDKYLNPVPLGIIGEIYLAGVGVARGYLDRPDLTAERFLPDPFGPPGTRMYRTGDLGSWHETGPNTAHLDYHGRADQQIKLRGYRIELGEIEANLALHPEVDANVVIVREDRPGDQRIVAYLIGKASETELRDFLRGRLPDYMIPSAYVHLKEFPLTPNHKIDRKRLPVPEITGANSKETLIPPHTDTEVTLANIMAEVLGIEKVGLYDNFFDLGGHSFLATQLAFRVQQAFQTELPLYRFFEDSTVHGLAAAIQGSLSETPQAQPTIEIRSDLANITLDPAIVPPTTQAQAVRSLQRVFLTGATGFLGVHLLADLLQQPDAIIYCLVRAPDERTARQKLFNHLQHHRLWKDAFTDRIRVVVGNLAEPDLGLPAGQFLTLAGQIDAIIHCGAWVNFIYPYESLKPANVLGTQTVLRLAALGTHPAGALPVHYISTLAVFDPVYYAHTDPIEEQIEPAYSPHLKGGYAQSKWAAEKLVWQAHQRALPVTIHRPGIISGSAQTGIWNTHDYFPLFVKGCIQLGAIPDQDTSWRLTPVDTISRALLHLVTRPASCQNAFHYLTPHLLHQHTLAEWLRQAGYNIEMLDSASWQARLKTIADDPRHALYPLLPLLLETGDTSDIENRFSTAQTDRGLTASGILYPKVDQTLFNSYLADFLRQGFID